MRDTFYSSVETSQQTETRFVEAFKLSNVLELSEKERAILAEIKRIMEEECEKLQVDIDEVHSQLID